MTFFQIIYLHVISTNFETRLPRYSLCFFWRGWNFVKVLEDPIIMNLLSEQVFWNFVGKIICVSHKKHLNFC